MITIDDPIPVTEDEKPHHVSKTLCLAVCFSFFVLAAGSYSSRPLASELFVFGGVWLLLSWMLVDNLAWRVFYEGLFTRKCPGAPVTCAAVVGKHVVYAALSLGGTAVVLATLVTAAGLPQLEMVIVVALVLLVYTLLATTIATYYAYASRRLYRTAVEKLLQLEE